MKMYTGLEDSTQTFVTLEKGTTNVSGSEVDINTAVHSMARRSPSGSPNGFRLIRRAAAEYFWSDSGAPFVTKAGRVAGSLVRPDAL